MIEVQPEACLQFNCPARLLSGSCDVTEKEVTERLPDDTVLGCAPEGVGPHGSRGDALDAIGVVGEHVGGLLCSQVVHVHFGVCGAGN